jgi:membrane associated rhomboid family serine protease
MNYNRGSILSDSPVVKNLIILNIIAFAAQKIITHIDITGLGSLHHYNSTAFRPYQLVTHMFLHDPFGFGHILFNMFGLFVFGSMLERFWGSKRFLFFYLTCGIGAGFAQLFFGGYGMAMGASGAIMGLMAAFAYLFPNTELMLMLIPFPVKAKYVIPVFILIDLFGGLYTIPGDNVAHFAHLGGAVVGFLIVLYWNKTNKKTFY